MFLIITDSGEAESESIPLKIRYDQIFFYESESIPLKIRYDQIFFYDPAQRHRDHRLRVLRGFVRDFFMIPHRGTEITEKNRASVFFAALCGISDCGPPLNPL